MLLPALPTAFTALHTTSVCFRYVLEWRLKDHCSQKFWFLAIQRNWLNPLLLLTPRINLIQKRYLKSWQEIKALLQSVIKFAQRVCPLCIFWSWKLQWSAQNSLHHPVKLCKVPYELHSLVFGHASPHNILAMFLNTT